MGSGPTVSELARMVERLLRELEPHDADYHRVTAPGLVREAKGLLWRLWAREGGAPDNPDPKTETEGEEGKT